MKIEIFEEDQHIIEEVRGSNTFFSQRAYLHRDGSRFPIEFKIPKNAGDTAYRIGIYEIQDSSFRVNAYGKLELDPYELKLKEIKTSDRK